MEKFCKSAKVLMNKLKYKYKFAAIALIILLLILGVVFPFTSQLNSQIQFNTKKQFGIEYINPTVKFLTEAQKYRYKSYLYLGGQEAADKEAAKHKANANTAIKSIQEVDSKFNKTLKINDRLNKILSQWKSIKKTEDYQANTKVINDTIALIKYISETSNLLLDSNLDTFYLVDAFSLKIPSLLNSINKAQIEGMKGINSTTTDKTSLITLYSLINENNNSLRNDIKKIYTSNPKMKDILAKDYNAALDANNKLISVLEKVIKKQIVPQADYIETMEKAYIANSNLYNAYYQSLSNLIEKRLNGYANQKSIVLIFTIIVELIILFLFTGFYLSMIGAINTTKKALENISEGDLTVQANIETQDEMNELSTFLNKFIKNFSGLIKEISTSTEKISKDSKQINTSAEQSKTTAQEVANNMIQVASSTKEQSINVDNAVKNINAVNSIVQNITNRTTQTVEITKSTQNIADKGKEHANNTIEKINGIKLTANDISENVNNLEQLSSEVEKIIDSIKNIASQTNQLALNAIKEVDDGLQVAENTSEALERIISSTEVSTNKVEQISKEAQTILSNSNNTVNLMEKASSVTKDSATNTKNMSDISQGQASNLEKINNSTSAMDKVAENLHKKVKTFKV